MAAHRAAGSGERQFPGWCFSRFGETTTPLPDGTVIYIAGEHEDSYDPDFYIYNDVVVVRPDCSIEIYGYPTDVFGPIDHHTATLIGDEIIIVGGGNKLENPDHDTTPVYRLRLSDFSISRVATTGLKPDWLSNHSAELVDTPHRIVCKGGEAWHPEAKMFVENLTTWELDLEVWVWTAPSSEKFIRWALVRESERSNELYGVGEVAKAMRRSARGEYTESFMPGVYRDHYRARFQERGHTVDADLYFARFSPPIPHRAIEREPGTTWNVHRILVDGVVVRYREDMDRVTVTVEGDLGPETIEALKQHGLWTYSALEGVPYKCIPL